MGRLPPKVRLGLALILFGILWLAGWILWQASYIWVPLDVPISLSQGHVRTRQFTVNAPGFYLVRIFVEWTSDADKASCFHENRCPGSKPLPMSWSLFDGQRIVARDNGDTANGFPWGNEAVLRELGTLKIAKGKYSLDLDVSGDGSLLNKGSPRLIIVENGDGYSYVEGRVAHASSLTVLSFVIGAFLIIHAAVERRRERRARFAREFSFTQPGPPPHEIHWTPSAAAAPPASPAHCRLPALQHQPARRRLFPAMPSFGFMAGNVYLFMAIIMMVLQSVEHRVPAGLRVRLLKPGVRFQSPSGMTAVLVRIQVAAKNLPPDIYIGSQRVAWDDFETILQTEINRRPPDWPVYLEGDPESDWASVASVIDRIRGLQAQVVLITRKSYPPGQE